MKLSKLKNIIRENIKDLKERKYLPIGRPLGSECSCCEVCTIDMEGSPWGVSCAQACSMYCEQHCSGGGPGMGSSVNIKISRR